MNLKNLFIVCLLGMATVTVFAANPDKKNAVNKNGFSFMMAAADVKEMQAAKWSAVFELYNSSNESSDYCLTASTIDGELYIASPDGAQEFVIRKGKLKRILNPVLFFEGENTWADFGEPLGSNRAKYVFGYDIDGNVYVVVYGR